MTNVFSSDKCLSVCTSMKPMPKRKIVDFILVLTILSRNYKTFFILLATISNSTREVFFSYPTKTLSHDEGLQGRKESYNFCGVFTIDYLSSLWKLVFILIYYEKRSRTHNRYFSHRSGNHTHITDLTEQKFVELAFKFKIIWNEFAT